MARKKTEEIAAPPVVAPAVVEVPKVELLSTAALAEKQESNLDILFPPVAKDTLTLSEAASRVLTETSERFSEPSTPATGSGEQKAKLTDIIDSLRRELRERIPGMNTLNTKDGSQFGVNIHNTRLVRGANALDSDLKSFVDFLTREGLEDA